MHQVVVLLMAVAALLTASSCGVRPGAADRVEQPLSAPTLSTVPPGYRETGTASWYGADQQGRSTASGEIFDMYGLSAAHRTLPLGTVISVTNLDNSRNIVLKVNDRGPFVRSRVLDVSYGAARELGFAGQGTAQVRIETVGPVADGGVFTVQAAVFTEEESAKLLRERLQRRFESVSIVPGETNMGRFYRVRVGSYGTEEKAGRIAAKLAAEGLEPLVLRKD